MSHSREALSRARARLRYRAQPGWIAPMLATLTERVPSGGGWVYEPKLDGVRVLAYVTGGSVRLFSRNRRQVEGGYPELVEALAGRGHRVVLASSSEADLVDALLDIVDVGHHLHAVVTGSDEVASKPAPDLLLAAVESVGGTDAIVIGDSVWDTRAAQAAGLPCLAVRTGGFDDAELMANGATAVYENPGELLKAPELWG